MGGLSALGSAIAAFSLTAIALSLIVSHFNLISIFNPWPFQTYCQLPLPQVVLGQWPGGMAWLNPGHHSKQNASGCPTCVVVQDVEVWHGLVSKASSHAGSTRAGASVVEPKSLLGLRAPLSHLSMTGRKPRGSHTPASYPESRTRVSGKHRAHDGNVSTLPPSSQRRGRQLEQSAASLKLHVQEYAKWGAAIGLAPLRASLVSPYGRPVSSLMFQKGSCQGSQQESPVACPLAEVRSAVVGGVRLVAHTELRPPTTSRPTALLLEPVGSDADVRVWKNREDHNLYHTLMFRMGRGNLW